MTAENHLVPVVLAASLLLRLAISDDLLLYLKPGMRPWVLAAAVTLTAITVGWLAAHRRSIHGEADRQGGNDDGTPDHGHDHGPSRSRWLLALPLAVFIAVPRAPLGAFAAGREPTRQTTPAANADVGGYPPLAPAVDGAHEMTLVEFVAYAQHDTERQLEGETVRLTGFVTPAGPGEPGFRLTRFVLACCAADGTPVSVSAHGATQPYPTADTWLVIEGHWRPDPSGNEPDVPAVQVTSMRQILPPTDPYEA